MNWDWTYAFESLPTLLDGLWVTVQITLLSSVVASVIGLALAIVRIRRIPVVNVFVRFFIDFIRGTPLLVQLFFMYYAAPSLGIQMSAFVTGVLVLGLYAGAYMSEVYRAGIENLPKGQLEASITIGLSPVWRWCDVIIPQAVRTVIPALGNYVIVMFKYTPLLTAITVQEMLSKSSDITSKTYRFLEPITLVGVLFLLVSIPSVYALRKLESRMKLAPAGIANEDRSM